MGEIDRRSLLQLCALLGLPVGSPLVAGCMPSSLPTRSEPPQRVIVVGAGAGGLATTHLLRQAGVEVTVLEAASTWGGRMKRTDEFVDFPIPLGAEWLHVERDVLDTIVNDSSVSVDVKTTPYDLDVDRALIEGEEVSISAVGFTIDQKFIGATWYDFFAEYVVPGIEDTLRYGQIVERIDSSGDGVVVSTSNEQYEADVVVVAVPVKMLQERRIAFRPELPSSKLAALDEVQIWGGCKAFIEFTDTFYPAAVGLEEDSREAGQRLFYDAAYGQDSNHHVLGLFAVGAASDPYTSREGQELLDYLLAELDELFDGQASEKYVQHIFQDWTREPFIESAYADDYNAPSTFLALSEPIDDRIYFAGDAYFDGTDWSSVHVAGLSARRTVEALLGAV